MPARYFLPLRGLEGPVPVEHLHAALSGWFDHVIVEDRVTAPSSGLEPHDFTDKPYTISPTTRRGTVWGVEIAVVGQRTEQELVANAAAGTPVRLGSTFVRAGAVSKATSASWQELLDYDGSTGWTVQFVTPFTYRSHNRSSPFPMPAAVLRSPTTVWQAYSDLGPIELSPAEHATIWVSRLDAQTELYSLKGRKHPGLVGQVTYRCTDPGAAAKVSTLLRFAQFSGVGSFRGKGMGLVSVTRI